jgi:hypothetical protein
LKKLRLRKRLNFLPKKELQVLLGSDCHIAHWRDFAHIMRMVCASFSLQLKEPKRYGNTVFGSLNGTMREGLEPSTSTKVQRRRSFR